MKNVNSIIGMVISILIAANAFFIVRLVDKLEKVEESAYRIAQSLAVLEARFESFTKKH